MLTAHAYGISLYKQSEKIHDGEVDGKKVQIKGTQGKDSIVIREEPEYLLHCNECGFEYEANGCDVAIRKCPKCQ